MIIVEILVNELNDVKFYPEIISGRTLLLPVYLQSKAGGVYGSA
jgi:hypothetical protein